MVFRKRTFFVSASVLVISIAGITIANEFIKKKPARLARKEAQQKEVASEHCATLADSLLQGLLKVQERIAGLTQRFYAVLRQLALGETCPLDSASAEKLKKLEAQLELLEKELAVFERCIQGSISGIDKCNSCHS